MREGRQLFEDGAHSAPPNELENEERIRRLFRKVLARDPSRSEVAGSLRYFEQAESNPDWAGFAQVLLCSNAFLYRD